MKKLFAILTLLISSLAFGQYANDWIDYSQNYYSFKIWQDGFYRIDYNTLSTSGVPVASIAPENYQLFAFEQEQQILVEDGGDGTFDAGDYILFHGKQNTTWLDSVMYDDPNDVANKYYPHYNDTITYFLSWNLSATNARIQEETDINFVGFTPVPYFLNTSYIEYHNRYLEGRKISGMSYSSYVDGEGWFSN